MRQWGEEDLAGILDWIAGHLRPKRLLVVGHSVGGQLVGLAANNHRVHALVMVGSQSAWWGHWPVPARYRMALTWFVTMPLVTRIYGYLPGRFGTKEDLPAGVAREWARWGRRRTYLMESEELRAGFMRFRRPLLAYSFTDDDYAPRPAVEGLLDFYSEADVYHRHLAPRDVGADAIGHFGFFRDRFRDSLWRDSAAWLQKQALNPVPSPASERGVTGKDRFAVWIPEVRAITAGRRSAVS
jgi:predicted alpha/beta hydrolase